MIAIAIDGIWVLCVWISFVGWGSAVFRRLATEYGAGRAACMGLSVAVIVGGVENLVQVVSPATNVLFVALGVAFSLSHMPQNFRWSAWRADVLLRIWPIAAVAVLIATLSVAYSYNFSFHLIDDMDGYMVFPAKILNGSLGFEPFSDRRLVTSLGGLYYLQSLILTKADFHWLHSIDPGFALITLVLLVDREMRSRDASISRRCLVLLLILLFIPTKGRFSLTENLSPTLIIAPLLLFIAWESNAHNPGDRGTSPRRMVSVSVATAALIAIKPLSLPFVGILLSGIYGLAIVRHHLRGTRMIEAGITALLSLILLLPWMIANARDTGTAMYPLLGSGFSTSNIDATVPSVAQLTALSLRLWMFLSLGLADKFVLLLFGLFAVVYIGRARVEGEAGARLARVGAFWAIGALVTALSICLGGGGANVDRYIFPFAIAGVLFFLVEIFNAKWDSRWYVRSAVLMCTGAILTGGTSPQAIYDGPFLNFRILATGPRPDHMEEYDALYGDTGATAAAVRRMQAAIPEGKVILERLDYPFLMNFHRNRVLVADWPGADGPAPGWPLGKGPGRLAAYFRQLGVDYIAYTYTGRRIITDEWVTAHNSIDIWGRRQLEQVVEFESNISEFMHSCPVLFRDDKRVAVQITESCVGDLTRDPRLPPTAGPTQNGVR